MILDKFLYMVDAITVGSSTAAVVTTSHVDTLAKSDDYEGCFINFLCETAILSGTAGATVTFALQTADSTATSAYVDLVSSGAIDDAITIAAYRYQTRIPKGAKRYLRGTVTTSQVTTSGTVSVFITKDSDMNSTMVA